MNKMDKHEKSTYTVKEIAEIMDTGLATVYSGLKQKQIPARQVGRRWIIPRAAFDQWFGERRAVKAKTQNGKEVTLPAETAALLFCMAGFRPNRRYWRSP